MNVITGAETVSLGELEATSLDGFNIIYAVPEDGPVAEGDNIDRSKRLWADRDELYMMRLGDRSEGESIRVLHIAVLDIDDDEAIERLKRAVSARLD
ncbi:MULTISPECIES: hypothetical protein [Halomonas]|uniref:hypothetical protein n=1 Tax=Halomonas TaxID=2745 RepID=UPI001C97EB4F|nr:MULTISPECIES: hypothetical protein [Halomonas]MBY6208721.1 hypothetical protein [Halomonas sp. DP3Y7-2]MBY6227192.1 hypothetical protein [Halomonas sp. DP3Y7-1]MCA0915059.1 hypothetical protein [Halomonas denitrificans]